MNPNSKGNAMTTKTTRQQSDEKWIAKCIAAKAATVIPREHDEALAALYHDLDRTLRELGSTKLAACEMAGFRRGYAGRRSTHFYDGGSFPREATLDDAREAIAAMPSDYRDLK